MALLNETILVQLMQHCCWSIAPKILMPYIQYTGNKKVFKNYVLNQYAK